MFNYRFKYFNNYRPVFLSQISILYFMGISHNDSTFQRKIVLF